MNIAVAVVEADFGASPSVFSEDARASIFQNLQLHASHLAALEHTAARAIETGDQSALEDIERIACGLKEATRVLARIVIEIDPSPALSLVKDDRYAITQN
jgi:hypothetical protein